MSYLKQMMPSWVNERSRRVILGCRQITWRHRSLPDFIIIGAQKSGTSSLFAYLIQHPQIFPSFVKEVHFFDGGLNPEIDNFEKGQSWYRAHFPLRKNMNAHSKTFEASPLYLFNPLAPKRIFDHLPDVKIIAALRNPTERAISHYFHEKRKGHELLPIIEALHEEEKRLEPIINNKDYKNNTFIHHSYKTRGLYRQQIERYLDYFPRQQVLILNSEALFGEPAHTLRQIYEFLGVNTGFQVKNLKPINVGSDKTKVSPDVYKYLNDYFSPHNQVLYDLVGKSYEW